MEDIKLAKASDIETLQADKVDIVEGKGLSTNDFTNAAKDKLDGIEEGATNYAHPANHDADMITETAAKKFVSQAEKDEWSSKIGSHGSLVVKQIAVISAGGSTADIPNGTLILELE